MLDAGTVQQQIELVKCSLQGRSPHQQNIGSTGPSAGLTEPAYRAAAALPAAATPLLSLPAAAPPLLWAMEGTTVSLMKRTRCELTSSGTSSWGQCPASSSTTCGTRRGRAQSLQGRGMGGARPGQQRAGTQLLAISRANMRGGGRRGTRQRAPLPPAAHQGQRMAARAPAPRRTPGAPHLGVGAEAAQLLGPQLGIVQRVLNALRCQPDQGGPDQGTTSGERSALVEGSPFIPAQKPALPLPNPGTTAEVPPVAQPAMPPHSA